jgi:spore germination protein GerM
MTQKRTITRMFGDMTLQLIQSRELLVTSGPIAHVFLNAIMSETVGAKRYNNNIITSIKKAMNQKQEIN